MGKLLQFQNKKNRIARFIGLLAVFFVTAPIAYSQVTEFQCEILQDDRLEPILEDLSERYNLEFAYANTLLNASFKKSKRVYSDEIGNFLENLFSGTNITFLLSGNSKVLLKSDLQVSEVGGEEQLTLHGKVLDTNGAPLPYVSILLDSAALCGLSDEEGNFTIRTPANRIENTVSFIFLGYEPLSVPLSALRTSPAIILRQKEFQLKEITILSMHKSLEPGLITQGIRVDPGMLRHLSASGPLGADVFRYVQLLPGVAAFDDTDASIRIRGGNSDETLIILDDIPIFKADHYFGIFSAINPSYIDGMRLYKNAMPVEYGGRTGGLLQLASSPNIDKVHVDLDLNLLTASANFVIPLGKHTGLLLGGRTTYTNANQGWLLPAASSSAIVDIPSGGSGRELVVGNPEFRFHDFNARFLTEFSEKQQLDASVYYSFDDFDNSYKASFRSHTMSEMIISKADYAQLSNWDNLGAALNYNHKFGPDWKVTLHGHYSAFSQDESLESSLIRITAKDTIRSGYENKQHNEVREAGAKVMAIYQKDKNQQLKIGISSVALSSELKLLEGDLSYFDFLKKGSESRLFASYRRLIADRFSFEAGSRIIYFSGTKKPYLSPQIQLGFVANESFSLKSSISRNYQFVRAFNHENRLGQSQEVFTLSNGETFPVGSSTNFMAGGTLRLSIFMLDMEVFYKQMTGVVEFAPLRNGFDDQVTSPITDGNYRLFSGTGSSAGFDVLLSAEHKLFSGWLAYTLSKTMNQFPEINSNTPFAAQNDRRHQLKWINTFHLGPFDLSGNYIFSSGRPYTDVTNLLPGQDRRDVPPADRQKRLPAYHRIDLGLTYGFTIKKAKAYLGASVFNLTNRQNISYYQFIYNIPGDNGENNNPRNNTIVGTQTDMLSRTLNLSFRIVY